MIELKPLFAVVSAIFTITAATKIVTSFNDENLPQIQKAVSGINSRQIAHSIRFYKLTYVNQLNCWDSLVEFSNGDMRLYGKLAHEV